MTPASKGTPARRTPGSRPPTAKKTAAGNKSSSKSVASQKRSAQTKKAVSVKKAATTTKRGAPSTRKAQSSATSSRSGSATSAKRSVAPKKSAAPKKTAPGAKKAAPAKKPAPPSRVQAAKKASRPAPKKAPSTLTRPGEAMKPKTAQPVRPKTGPYAKDAKFLEEVRDLLLAERAIYQEQATSLRAEADSLALEREPGDVQFDEESGEGGTVTVDRERNLALSGQATLAVEEIDGALRRILEKTYGYCERCFQPIPKPRLRALPYARLCVACKSGGLSRR